MSLRSLLILLMTTVSAAAADWRAEEVAPNTFPPEVVNEARAPVSTITEDGLPDGLIASGTQNIEAAWYEDPTRRYAHGILGDAVEAGSLIARLADGTILSFDLPPDEVFEDRYPRLADLDQDGRDEIITIRSSRAGGGGVAVYGVSEDRLVEVSNVPPIGQPNRWLNIAGIADLHPAPGLEIAFVRTPHIGGTLRLFGWAAGHLKLIDEEFGFSNHAIGSPEMRLSALADLDGDGFAEMALPSADRREVVIVSFANGIVRIAAVEMPGRIDKAINADDDGFAVGISSGRVFRIAIAN